jgi:hypothetical protein
METLSNSNYDEDEVEHRHGIVTADLNCYIAKKYPWLTDAEFVLKSSKSHSVLDICGVRLKEKGNNKPWFLCLMGKCFSQ